MEWVFGIIIGLVVAGLTDLPDKLEKELENWIVRKIRAAGKKYGIPTSTSHGWDGNVSSFVKGQPRPPMYLGVLVQKHQWKPDSVWRFRRVHIRLRRLRTDLREAGEWSEQCRVKG